MTCFYKHILSKQSVFKIKDGKMEMSKRQTEVFAINDEKWNPTHFSNISNKY